MASMVLITGRTALEVLLVLWSLLCHYFMYSVIKLHNNVFHITKDVSGEINPNSWHNESFQYGNQSLVIDLRYSHSV